MASAGVSVHAVDVAHGRVAEGLMVSIHAMDDNGREVASGAIGSKGLLDHPSAQGVGMGQGVYEIRFAIGAYFRQRGVASDFLDLVPFRFIIRDEKQHVHLPLKFTPFGFSIWRGA
jgi:5-hydroxyisourate hydrolase